MAGNFKDEASLARWQEDMYKKGIPYEESKQYAIDNKMTFGDGKSVKMYTGWKGNNSGSSIEFKNGDEFQKIVNSIDDSKLSEDDLNSLYEALSNSKIGGININELGIKDLNKATSKQIDRAVKQKTTDKGYDELMGYYDDDDNEGNEDIYNQILYSSDLSSEEKEKKLNELKTNIQNTRLENLENTDDDINSINKAIEKNKGSEKLVNKLRDGETGFLGQKAVRENKGTNITTTKNLTKEYGISQADYNDYIKQLQTIASSSKSDRKKYWETKRLKEEWNKKISNLSVYYNHNYGDKPLSANKGKELTDTQKAEKKMIENYLAKGKMLNEKANAYIDSYGGPYYFEGF